MSQLAHTQPIRRLQLGKPPHLMHQKRQAAVWRPLSISCSNLKVPSFCLQCGALGKIRVRRRDLPPLSTASHSRWAGALLQSRSSNERCKRTHGNFSARALLKDDYLGYSVPSHEQRLEAGWPPLRTIVIFLDTTDKTSTEPPGNSVLKVVAPASLIL
jgi:hypothetical protein